MQTLKLGIAGLGTVAQGVLEIVAKNGEMISQRTGVKLEVQRVASRSKKDVDLLGAQFSQQLQDLVTDPEVDIVLELIGGESHAYELIVGALNAGKPVVTANKAVIANHGNELCGSNGYSQSLKFEAAVAGAIPIISALKSGLVVNQFDSVLGIINGTCNYILTQMLSAGTSFSDALTDAQALGYAEADPTFDIEGIDAAHKLTILLALAFDCGYDFDQLYVQGISHVSAADIKYAQELGYKIKHLGIARRNPNGIEARVHPTLVPTDNLLASVDGVLNAVLVNSDASGTTLFSGPGAGGLATASAVLADVLACAQNIELKDSEPAAAQTVTAAPILPMQEVVCANYLRIPTLDEPGVFAKIAQLLSEHNISIEAVIQKEPSTEQASIVMLTNAVSEAVIDEAVAQVESLEQVIDTVVRIRVEN